MSDHISESTARRAIRGELTPEEQSTVDAHLLVCDGVCPALMEQIANATVVDADVLNDATPPGVPGYAVESELGRGGMGVVYQARDLSLHRSVAIKVMHARFRKNPVEFEARKKRFLDEAYIIAQLQHPGITPIYELGTLPDPDGRPFFAAKLVRGKTLGGLLRDRATPGQERFRYLQIFASICDCLAYAHERNVLHRDLKPGNVMVDERFQIVHVLDWGIGKVREAEAAQATKPGTVVETPRRDAFDQTQGVLGTYPYMSREQALGRAHLIDARSDVFGLGAILCEVLTGRPPYFSDHPDDRVRYTEVKQAAEDGTIEPSYARLDACGADRELIALAKRCLSRDEKQRPANAGEVSAAIREHQRKVEARIHRQRLMRWMLVAAGVALLLLTAGITGTALAWRKARQHEKTAREKEALAKAETARADQNAGQLKKALGKAEQLATAEQKAKERTEEILAGVRIGFANELYERNQVARARETLGKIPPQYRGWEWHYLQRKFDGAFAIFYGHTDWVNSVSFSPDGQRIASGSNDRIVRVWNAVTGEALLEVKGHTAGVTCVGFSPDGRRIASGGWDTTVRVWDAVTGQPLLELKGHTREVSSVSFSPDGQRIASGSSDGTVRVWHAATGQSLLELKAHRNVVTSVSFSPDGRRIASAGWETTVRVWHAVTGQPLLELKGHTDFLETVSFSPDGWRIASAGKDRAVRLWDATTGQSLLELKGHTGEVYSVRFSPDGQRIASGSWDSTVRLWDATSGQPLLELKGHTETVYSVAFSPNGQRIASGGKDKTVRVWNAVTGQSLLELKGHTNAVESVSFSPNGQRIASGSTDGTVRVWNAGAGQVLLELTGHTAAVRSVSFSPDGQRIASGSADGTLRVWDVNTRQSLLELEGHTGEVSSVSFSPDGQRIASGCSDGTVRVWNAATEQLLLELKGHLVDVRSVSFSPDGQRIASGCSGGTVRVWHTGTRQLLVELKGPTEAVYSVSFSPDGQRIASGGQDRAVRVWNAVTGQSLLELKGHTNAVYSVSFSPDGQRIVSGSTDETVRVWNAATGQSLLELKGHTNAVYSVSFSPDGQRIASGGDSTGVRVWKAATAQSPLELKGHTGKVYRVSFSSDGQEIASGDPDRTVWVWNAVTGELLSSGKEWPSWAINPSGAAISPDGKTIAHIEENLVRLIPLAVSDDEKAFRMAMSRIDSHWAIEQAEQAEQAERWFAAAFQRSVVAEARSWDRQAWHRAEEASKKLGDFTHAIRACDRLLAKHSRSAPLYWQRARLHGQAGKLALAFQDLLAGTAEVPLPGTLSPVLLRVIGGSRLSRCIPP